MKRIITVLSFTFLSVGLFAQNKILLGFEGGGGIRYLYGNWIADKENPILGGSAGLTFQYNLSKIFSFKTGISYDRKGWGQLITITDNQGNNSYKTTAKFNFDYIIVPLLIKASFGNKIKYFVNTGPYFGYLINSSRFISGEGFRPDKNNDIDEGELLKSDFGLSTGLGLCYPINEKFNISLEIRNNYGLKNLNSGKYSNVNTWPFYASSTNILLGVNYILK
jgi:hypothetical protein